MDYNKAIRSLKISFRWNLICLMDFFSFRFLARLELRNFIEFFPRDRANVWNKFLILTKSQVQDFQRNTNWISFFIPFLRGPARWLNAKEQQEEEKSIQHLLHKKRINLFNLFWACRATLSLVSVELSNFVPMLHHHQSYV